MSLTPLDNTFRSTWYKAGRPSVREAPSKYPLTVTKSEVLDCHNYIMSGIYGEFQRCLHGL